MDGSDLAPRNNKRIDLEFEYMQKEKRALNKFIT